MHDREYYAIRTAAALIDVSPIYKYLVAGPGAMRLLNRVVTRDVTRCAVGQALYTPWCNAAGKVMDDGLVARLDEATFALTSAEPALRWLHDNAFGMDVEIEDVSAGTAAAALQGPFARDILSQVAVLDPGSRDVPGSLDRVKYQHLAWAHVGGVPAVVSRTGYTGDLGYEIWVRAVDAPRLWDVLIEAGEPYGILPAGLLALDQARVEAGLILIGVDYVPAPQALTPAQTSSPFELGLGWAVDLDKGHSNGRQALLDERAEKPAWRLAGLEISWDAIEGLYASVGLPPQLPTTTQRSSVPVYAGRRQVGYATSRVWSPLLKRYLALAHLEGAHARHGEELAIEVTVEHRRLTAAARVVKLPFFEPERKRA